MTNTAERDFEAREQRGSGCNPGRHWADEMLPMLVHDLRSPLGAIQYALGILRLVPPADPVVERALGTIERQVGHLGRLIGDLLDLSRVTTGKLELCEEWLDLGTVVAQAVEACRPVLEQHRHQLTVSLPPEPLQLRADPARLQQVLVNLLTNAAKYTDPGGHIGVSAEPAAGTVEVRIRDNGIGIGPDLLPHVFDLFRQGSGLGKRGQNGLGVGLALVKWLVELHGGSVAACSDGPGKGAEFTVRLPTPLGRMIQKLPPALSPPPRRITSRRTEIQPCSMHYLSSRA